jgi:hypothetical protein
LIDVNPKFHHEPPRFLAAAGLVAKAPTVTDEAVLPGEDLLPALGMPGALVFSDGPRFATATAVLGPRAGEEVPYVAALFGPRVRRRELGAAAGSGWRAILGPR